MNRVYKEADVYTAAMERIDFVFKNFERIYLSFSGGKDSGVLLNIVAQYMRENNSKKIGVMVMDNETNYQHSLDFMHSILEANRDIFDVYWICLPLSLPCSVSAYRTEWQCWLKEEEKQWVRPMPEHDYVVNEDNMPFDFFRPKMLDKDFYDNFGQWYSQGVDTACMIGIRADESLNRFRAIMNDRKETLKGKMWTKKNTENCYMVYPIYDWKVGDVWTANAKFEFEYNKLYDLFYKAGVPVGSMRVASAFMSESKSSLNLYRVIDPSAWANLCARVQGANFAATYGKQINYNNFTLPEGHTWKSFVKFLLSTLPEETAENFKKRFIQSIKYWARVGRGLSDEIIAQLEEEGINYKINGTTPHGGNLLKRVSIRVPPDNMDFLKSEKGSVTSWKRFGLTILKNDHTCKYMGLAPTKAQAERQKQIQLKYKSIEDMKDIYETRTRAKSKIIKRKCPVIYTDSPDMDSYIENGYLKIEGFFDPDLIKNLFVKSREILNTPCYKNYEPGSEKIRSVLSIYDSFSEVINDKLKELINKIIGPAYIHQSRINYKNGISNGWSWHSDFETWHAQDGMEKMICCSAMIPLEENTENNGCLKIIPHSHKYYISSPKGTECSAEENFSDQKEGVPSPEDIEKVKVKTKQEEMPILCVPGDLIIFDCNILHGSECNKTEGSRTNLYFVFNHVLNQLKEPYNYDFTRPEEMAARDNIVRVT